MAVVFCGVAPHPPIVVPEVGRREAEKVSATAQALLQLGQRVKKSQAEILVIISPHSPLFNDAIAVNSTGRLTGDLGNFGAPGVSFDCAGAPVLAGEIVTECKKLDLMAVALDQRIAGDFNTNLALDHGVTVPLYFLRQAEVDLPLVVVSMAPFSLEKLYRFGVAVHQAAQTVQQQVALIASGDLSHCLTPGAPGGYQPAAAAFDQKVVQLVAAADAQGLMEIDAQTIAQAGECGLRPVVMMLGALDGRRVEAEVLSYQAPFGVGYLVATLKPGVADAGRSILGHLAKQQLAAVASRRQQESFLVQLARQTLESYVLGQPAETAPEQVPAEFNRPAATFVSIKKNGQLRGCIGSVLPQRQNIKEEVIHNAISAGIHDPRFHPVRPEELADLDYSVDVLSDPEPVAGIAELDPKKYGVIVKSGGRKGLLLPNLEGINTVQEQVRIAREKASITPDEEISLERFEVIRYQ
ncbi:AmmeMemoRadiSam system protein A [Peptococcaceae bacterium]|nr:AmmeMemoRadiSam system protein A [Peptococcaceae bacterium]